MKRKPTIRKALRVRAQKGKPVLLQRDVRRVSEPLDATTMEWDNPDTRYEETFICEN